MILSGSLKQAGMAAAAGCSERTIRAIATNLRLFGKTKAPPNGTGQRRRVTPQMLTALCEHLLDKPGLFREEMAVFLYDEFNVLNSVSSIGRALADIKWSKKMIRRVAQERNVDLRDLYLHEHSEFHSWQCVYIDESGYDKRIGFRRTDWSPLGVTPVQITHFHGIVGITFFRLTHKMAYYFPRYFKVRLTGSYSRNISSSSFIIMDAGRSGNQFLSWIMHPSITVTGSIRCVMTQASNCSICIHTHQT
jgi:hypothetical protein